nr:MAG TPA: hypothetical protein [Caudoviricetes sp.]
MSEILRRNLTNKAKGKALKINKLTMLILNHSK